MGKDRLKKSMVMKFVVCRTTLKHSRCGAEIGNFGVASLLLVNNLSIAFLCWGLSVPDEERKDVGGYRFSMGSDLYVALLR